MDNEHDKVRSYIIETFLFGQGDGFEADTSFLEEGILDSTGVMELVAHLEETYDIKIEDDELLPENLDSVNLICEFVSRKKGAAVGA
jgi:acyl carrier protein